VRFDDNVISLTSLTLKQKVQICEMLPMAVSQQVVSYIETVRKKESIFTSITTKEGKVEIPIDSQLFNR